MLVYIHSSSVFINSLNAQPFQLHGELTYQYEFRRLIASSTSNSFVVAASRSRGKLDVFATDHSGYAALAKVGNAFHNSLW